MSEKKKVLTVDEVLSEIQAQRGKNGKVVVNRFNKKKFEQLLKAMFNDSQFKTTCAKVKKGELSSVEEIAVTQNFRKFIQKVLEKAGMDKAESGRVLTDDFTIDSASGLYEFFATAMYLYMEQGNKFDLIPKNDFRGSVTIKSNKSSKKQQEIFHPKTRDSLGTIEIDKAEHKTLSVKSTCPAYLKKRKQVK